MALSRDLQPAAGPERAVTLAAVRRLLNGPALMPTLCYRLRRERGWKIELKNAVGQSPEDPALRVQLAQVYFQLDDFSSAEGEARAARELNGNEADYLPILVDALLARQKFTEILDIIEPDDRDPVLESRVRTAIGIAAAGLGYGEKSSEMLRDAILSRTPPSQRRNAVVSRRRDRRHADVRPGAQDRSRKFRGSSEPR